MKDDLVRRLRDSAKISDAIQVLLPNSDGNHTAELFNEAANAIEELQNALDAVNDAHNEGYDVGYWAGRRDYEPKWIPVTERLPEEDQLVIGFTPVDGYMFVGYCFIYSWGSKTLTKWKIITAMRSTKDITKKVTHWMPLMPPPEENDT